MAGPRQAHWPHGVKQASTGPNVHKVHSTQLQAPSGCCRTICIMHLTVSGLHGPTSASIGRLEGVVMLAVPGAPFWLSLQLLAKCITSYPASQSTLLNKEALARVRNMLAPSHLCGADHQAL